MQISPLAVNEADTCRKFVVPLLQAAGWDDEPHSIAEQRTFTDGRIVPVGKGFVRKPPKRADYLLRYTRDFPLAVVEAKAGYKTPADGLQQAKDYAEMLGLKFAYATNGHEIIEFDYLTGIETTRRDFPTPDELWRATGPAAGITDDDAAERLLDALQPRRGKATALLPGDRHQPGRRGHPRRAAPRLLLTMATGTGKTAVAFQICWKLWTARWNRTGEHRRPRILYLADRNILVDEPKDKTSPPSATPATRSSRRGRDRAGRCTSPSTRRSPRTSAAPACSTRVPARLLRPRSSSTSATAAAPATTAHWREILEYFEPAYQLGMTATPLREDNRDTYRYFGNPIYTYSLRQGIDDGFLAPYRVHRVVTEWDAAGWRPSKDELDRYGREIPDEEYQTKDFERVVALRARTEAIARHLTEFLKKTDRFAKTIVFCVDQEHAERDAAGAGQPERRPRRSSIPTTSAASPPTRATSGAATSSRFQDVEHATPVILTTSQLLTTGVDAPTCKNVVLARVVNSMTEFKQIIGRGTRVRDDYGKLCFNILDYTGSATRLFADPDFDGDPAQVTEEELDEEDGADDGDEDEGIRRRRSPTATPGGDHRAAARGAPQVLLRRRPGRDRRAPGLRARPRRQAAARRALHRLHRREGPHAAARRARSCASSGPTRRSAPRSSQRLAERGIELRRTGRGRQAARRRPVRPALPPRLQRPAAHPPRAGPAAAARRKDFFDQYGPEARQILDDLLEKYADHGDAQFVLPDVLKVPPINATAT